MTTTVYLNGEYVDAAEAKVSIFDRGLLFGDAVYEVAGVMDGRLVDFAAHMRRLTRSLGELSIPAPLGVADVLAAYRKLVRVNDVSEGLVYMQITRGEAERDFVWPEGLKPNVFMFTQQKTAFENRIAETGVSLKSVPDIRWARRDIKSVNLLGQVLAKRSAADAGAYEALMIDADGFVTECGCTSFFIVVDGMIITRALSNMILPGVTRSAVLRICETRNMRLEQRPVSLEQARAADEAFITGASIYVLPVVRIDDQPIAAGRPGPVTVELRDLYIAHAAATAV